MLTEEEKQALQARTFEMDCPSMELSQCGGAEQHTYSGPGFIRQTSDGKFLFKLYPCGVDIGDEFSKSFDRVSAATAGRLLPEHHYFNLRARDLKGRHWTGERITIEPTISSDGVVITGEAYELSNTEKRRGPRRRDSLELTVVGDVDIPCNRTTVKQVIIAGRAAGVSGRANVAEFGACNCSFLLTKNDTLTVRVDTDWGGLRDPFDLRIIEALQFVLARPLQWYAMRKCVGDMEVTKIRAPRPDIPQTRLRPPIAFTNRDEGEAVWRLFARYLRHVLRDREPEQHPLSAWISFVREGSSSSLNTQGLALAVGVEGVLKTEFPTAGMPNDDFKLAVKDAQHRLQTCVTNEDLAKRLEGSLGAMLSPRASDRLYALASRNAVLRAQIAAWERLRNSTTHADRPDLIPLQELLDLCHTVTVLLYHIVFCAIGYEGVYTDYSTHGWPTRKYPPETENAVSTSGASGGLLDKSREDSGRSARS